ncbi:hypothetical protein XENOCAPTIV_022300, partial [Xenoophorus captivus]
TILEEDLEDPVYQLQPSRPGKMSRSLYSQETAADFLGMIWGGGDAVDIPGPPVEGRHPHPRIPRLRSPSFPSR